MRKSSSKNGLSSVKLVSVGRQGTCELLEETTSIPERFTQTRMNLREVRSNPNPLDTWKEYQARSILGAAATPERVKELVETYDFATRLPKVDAPAPTRFARALRALRLAMGSVLLGMGVSACSGDGVGTGLTVRKQYDEETGVACYYLTGNYSGISCVQVRQGTKP